MNLIIIGHGPSMMQNKWGEFIDSHDVVVRLKRQRIYSSDEKTLLDYPEYFGTKTDIVAGSYNIAKALPKAPKYWIFVDSRHQDVTNFDDLYEFFDDVYINKELCDYWDGVYRGMRPEGKGHPHTSQGMKAIIYACQFAKRIDLVGFDNLSTGDFTWSLTRGPDHTYPDHNWEVEHKLAPIIAKHYGVKLYADNHIFLETGLREVREEVS